MLLVSKTTYYFKPSCRFDRQYLDDDDLEVFKIFNNLLNYTFRQFFAAIILQMALGTNRCQTRSL